MIPRIVQSVVALMNWIMMVKRPMLSIFAEGYKWIQAHQDKTTMVAMPNAVRYEMSVAAATLFMARQDLTTPWDLNPCIGDASEYGGAVLTTRRAASIEEIQNEAKWATRGGWMAYTGNDQAHELLASVGLYNDGQEHIAALPPTVDDGYPVYTFIHLFSGHARDGDLEEYLKVGGAKRGWVVRVINVDLGRGEQYDLANPEVVETLRQKIAAGLIDGGHSGPPMLPGGDPEHILAWVQHHNEPLYGGKFLCCPCGRCPRRKDLPMLTKILVLLHLMRGT